MKICVIGAGGVGSTFALLLARAGHAVTLVARGERLRELARDGLRAEHGAAASVEVRGALPADVPFDLVLVTVLAAQVEPLLPALRASSARVVMFMFNTFGGLAPLREAVGEHRFALGFPAVMARVEAGRLSFRVVPRALGALQITTVGGANADEWARTFSAAGVPCVVHPDMDSWLRTHAAFMTPLMVAGHLVRTRARGLSWALAGTLARAMRAGFAWVRAGGQQVTPGSMVALSRTPVWLVTALLWGLSRSPLVRTLGARGPAEARWLIDAMELEPLRALRP